MRSIVLVLVFLLALQLPAAPAAHGDGCLEPADAEGAYAFPADCHGIVPGGFGTAADHFSFVVPERSRLVFMVSNDATRFHDTLLVDLVAPDGTLLAAPNAGRSSTVRAGGVAEGPGIARLRLDGFGIEDGDIPYRFTAWLEPAPPPVPPQDDCGSGGDAAGHWGPALLLSPGACAAALARYDDPDRYGDDALDRFRIALEEGETLFVNFTWPADPLDAAMCLSGVACAGPEGRIVAQATQTREHHLWVEAHLPRGTGQVPYAFELATTPPVYTSTLLEGKLQYGVPIPYRPWPGAEAPGVGPLEGTWHAWLKLPTPAAPLDRATLRWDAAIEAPFPKTWVTITYYQQWGDELLSRGSCSGNEMPLECPPSPGSDWAYVNAYPALDTRVELELLQLVRVPTQSS